MSDDRRRSSRVEIVGRIHGHAVSLDVQVEVKEISLGGMALITPFPFPVGAHHEFLLTLGDGSTVYPTRATLSIGSRPARMFSRCFSTSLSFCLRP